GRGIKIDPGDAGADVELQIPERRPSIRRQDIDKIGQDGNFLAAVVQVNHIDIEPALEEAAAEKVEIFNVPRALADQRAIGRGELAKALSKPVSQDELRRAGEIQAGGGKVHGVGEVVERH